MPPKRSWREFSLAIADLWLISEGSREWVKEPRVRRVWHLSIVSVLVTVSFVYFTRVIAGGILETSELWSLVWRLTTVASVSWLLILEAILAALYYRYLLSTGRDLRFRNIVVFWTSWVVLFATLYITVYQLNPALFSYPSAEHIPGKTLHFAHGSFLPTLKPTFHFLLYSACTTVSLSVPDLSSASLVVSALNLVETLGSLLLLALLVATLVHKSVLKKDKA
jgi:hypothetical protein